MTAEIEPQDNPVLRGNFAPVHEELTGFDLPVSGTLPPELNGILMRNGPNPIAPRPGHHWFAGDAMLHAIQIEGGRARAYRNRWVRTENVQTLKGFAAAPRSPHQPGVQGSGAVNVISHGGQILALPEVGLPWAMDRELNTLGQWDFSGKLRSSMTAHPKIDGRTGELLFFGYDFGPVHLRYHRANAKGEIERSIEIDKPHPTMMHDFAVTATRVVFLDLPVVFDLDMAMQGRSLPFRWREEMGARVGVLARDADSDQTQWIEAPTCYVYHPLNAYDDGERIRLDLVRHENTFVGGSLESDGHAPRLERWTIDPMRAKVDCEVIDERGQEFPRVDSRVECHRHRFGYSVEFPSLLSGPAGLLKYDLHTGQSWRHDVGEGGGASEGVFVPASARAGEDEGYVLSVVYDPGAGRSHVRVIDAQRFDAPPIATVAIPARVPYGFHGNWIPTG